MEFVLNRNYTFASTKGHIISFRKGQPVYVPPELHKDVAAFGAEPVEGEVDLLGPEEKVVVPLTPGERADLLVEAFKVMEARNERGDFNAQGLPSAKVLEKITGLSEVSSVERNEVWQKYREGKAE